MAKIRNVVYYQTGILTNPADTTVLYDSVTTGQAGGKGLYNVQIAASGPITVTYTTIHGVTVTDQVWTLTNPYELDGMAFNHLELGATLTGTLEIIGLELMQ